MLKSPRFIVDDGPRDLCEDAGDQAITWRYPFSSVAFQRSHLTYQIYWTAASSFQVVFFSRDHTEWIFSCRTEIWFHGEKFGVI